MQIFSSKGDIGVFRNNKRETTVPMVVHGCLFSYSLVIMLVTCLKEKYDMVSCFDFYAGI